MRNVLVIASHFPPNPPGGVVRVSKMVKYLPSAGWNPIVMTSDQVGDPDLCTGLLRDVGRAAVRRLPALDVRLLYAALRKRRTAPVHEAAQTEPATKKPSLGARWLVPDHMLAWALRAVPAGIRLVHRRSIHVVYATGPCHSALLCGALVARAARVPFIAELRDPWTTNPIASQRASRILNWLDHTIEHFSLRSADRIVVISDGFIDPIMQRHPGICHGRFRVIPNGYDPADFVGILPHRFDHFAVVHTGNFYESRSPIPFISACTRLFRRREDIARALRIHFVGAMPAGWESAGEGYTSNFIHVPRLSHRECLAMNCGADVLLLVPGPGAGTMTGKVFEYMAAGRPILALAEPGVARGLIDNHSLGRSADPNDPEAIAAAVEALYDARGTPFSTDATTLRERFSRRRLAELQARCLDEVSGR